MKSKIFITALLLLAHSNFAQSDSISYGGDTALIEVAQKAQQFNAKEFDELMITPPQKMHLPLRSRSAPLSLYTPTYNNYGFGIPSAPEQNKDLNNFYLNYNNNLNFQVPERNKVWDILGISATAFVWGMVVKQAIDAHNYKPQQPKQKQPQ